jgi:hypothetical protein
VRRRGETAFKAQLVPEVVTLLDQVEGSLSDQAAVNHLALEAASRLVRAVVSRLDPVADYQSPQVEA